MMDSTTRRNQLQRKKQPSPSLLRWGAVLLWLAIWQLGAVAMNQPLLLPSPIATALRLFELGVTAEFWVITLGSLARIVVGFLFGIAVGSLLAVATSLSRVMRAVISLPMGIIKATPVASFAILALLFIRGRYFSVFVSFLMVLPLVWNSLDSAIAGVEEEKLAVADLFGMRRRDKLRYIYLPEVLPPLLASARTGMGFAWKAGIAGEVIAIPVGAIGTQLYNAKVYLETTDVFAWTGVVILLSLLLEWLMVAAVGKLPNDRE